MSTTCWPGTWPSCQALKTLSKGIGIGLAPLSLPAELSILTFQVSQLRDIGPWISEPAGNFSGKAVKDFVPLVGGEATRGSCGTNLSPHRTRLSSPRCWSMSTIDWVDIIDEWRPSTATTLTLVTLLAVMALPTAVESSTPVTSDKRADCCRQTGLAVAMSSRSS